MDIAKLVLNQSNTGPDIEKLRKTGNEMKIDADEQHKMKVARDFEAIFVREILSNMKNTIPESESEDAASGQVKGMYWSFLGDALADKGGFGMWEKIYEQMSSKSGKAVEAVSGLDKNA